MSDTTSYANIKLAKAVVGAVAGEGRESLSGRFSEFALSDWNSSWPWLDESGLELYLLARVKALELESTIPAAMLRRMDQNFADNKVRTSAMFDEFVNINLGFLRADLMYCNVRGFALVPISCPDPALRRQISFDFMMRRDDSGRCQKVLTELGYVVHALSEQVLEYRSPPIAEGQSTLYKPSAQRSIMVYFVADSAEAADRAPYEMLLRRKLQTWNGFTFYALQDSDHFVAQAISMLGHLGIERTRLAYLFEYWTGVNYWQSDEKFWGEVSHCAQQHPLRSVALGTASLSAANIFGGDLPVLLRQMAATKLEANFRLWSETYRWDALLIDYPATRLDRVLREPHCDDVLKG